MQGHTAGGHVRTAGAAVRMYRVSPAVVVMMMRRCASSAPAILLMMHELRLGLLVLRALGGIRALLAVPAASAILLVILVQMCRGSSIKRFSYDK